MAQGERAICFVSCIRRAPPVRAKSDGRVLLSFGQFTGERQTIEQVGVIRHRQMQVIMNLAGQCHGLLKEVAAMLRSQ